MLKRYFIDAMSAMAMGLFASLIIGLIISQLSLIPGLGFLGRYTEVLSASSPVVGGAIGAAIAWGLKAKPLVIFSAVAAGALAILLVPCRSLYWCGRWFRNCFIGGRKTKIDIVLVPFLTIVAGGIHRD